MSMAIDWTKIYQKYQGLWVALKDDEKTVIASGNAVKEAMDKAVKKGYKKPLLLKLPNQIVPYVGIFR